MCPLSPSRTSPSVPSVLVEPVHVLPLSQQNQSLCTGLAAGLQCSSWDSGGTVHQQTTGVFRAPRGSMVGLHLDDYWLLIHQSAATTGGAVVPQRPVSFSFTSPSPPPPQFLTGFFSNPRRGPSSLRHQGATAPPGQPKLRPHGRHALTADDCFHGDAESARAPSRPLVSRRLQPD